ncbi:N-acetylmuramoyl-L-alanine amidase AmpD [Vibrio cholerae]|nr:N-acetylmuramoyl-L-alanine amidase AmpD [Vibrio cholerae]
MIVKAGTASPEKYLLHIVMRAMIVRMFRYWWCTTSACPPGQFGGPYIEQFFLGELDANQHSFFKVIAKMRVSAHCVIRRDGEVVQFVPFHLRAWHAGVSSFAGRAKCNDYSIGIELEGSDFVPYTDAQYQALAELTQALMVRYPHITLPRITGHQYIAPLRKTDPGLVFDWRRFRAGLKS